MPRIIAGRAGGIRLRAPAGERTRPTADKVKEALFSILTPWIRDCRFLDVYAGSGQIGLEAVSRGAESACLIEQARLGLECIRNNIEKTGLGDHTRVLAGSAASQLQRLLEEQARFDLIFLDPPWQQAGSDFIAFSETLSKLLAKDGRIILEHDSRQPVPDLVTKLKCIRRCQYGSAMLSFYSGVDQETR